MVQTGKAAFQKAGEKLVKETADKKSKEETALVATKNSLEVIRQNKELASLYQGSAGVGAENLAGSLPLLKVHAAGRSSSNQLADGTDPADGAFFYKPTQEQFQSLDVHVLTISKGYRTDGLQKQNVFHQVLAGVITNDNSMKPFIMFFTGLKLRNLWDFGKEAGAYTKNATMPIPLFSLTVKMTTERQKTDYGYAWVVKFAIGKNEDGTPTLVIDPVRFKQLRLAVSKAEDMIASLIETKTTESPETLPSGQEEQLGGEAKDIKDIPF